MRILTVAFFDDNYGDMLIRTCFTQLAKVALKNLRISDYTLDVMPLKEPDTEKIVSADLIVFAGGGLFGLSYLNFAGFIEQILDEADTHGIPVVFSSLGINNMDATEENEKRLTAILQRPCIKAMSVRENQSVFEHYAPDRAYEISPVCDPVIWAKPIYNHDVADILAAKRDRTRPVVGINLVRGGLFKDNGVDWALTKEEEYLFSLSQMLDERNIDCRFFTNGSTWDVNTLRHFEKKYKIPREKLIISHTSREVIQAIADFDAVVAIRMHASIIAYALSVPSVNFVWNPKISELYRKIGFPERAVSPSDWSAEKAMQMTVELLSEREYRPDPELQMSLYRFLFESFKPILAPGCDAQMFDYEAVSGCLREMTVPEYEDTIDMRTKLKRAENRYYALFMSDDRKKGEILRLKKDVETLQKDRDSLKKKLKDEQTQRQKAEQERDAALAELERLNQKRSFRAYRKLFDNNK